MQEPLQVILSIFKVFQISHLVNIHIIVAVLVAQVNLMQEVVAVLVLIQEATVATVVLLTGQLETPAPWAEVVAAVVINEVMVERAEKAVMVP